MSAVRLTRAALKIPKRIERGPTDILKALASTVKYIPTEPDTLLLDDPYLLPVNHNDRNIFSLSKISGRNTAKFLLNKHPELFYRDDSEPKVRSFNAPEAYQNDMEFDICDLKWCIDNKDVVNGAIAYKSLVERDNVKLDQELLLQFFELLCYTNEDPLFDSLEHQKSFFIRESDRLSKQNWRITGLASKIFNQIKQDVSPSRVYSAMISGLSKHNEHQIAKQIFDEFKEFHTNEGLYVEAYAYLLSSVSNLNSSVETAHSALEDIIKHMEQHLVVPDLRVFNSILDVYKRFNCDANTYKTALQLFNDMRSLNVAPSPYSFCCVLQIISRVPDTPRRTDMIENLLSYMLNSNESLKIRDERDTQFLLGSMKVAVHRLNNTYIASKIFKIYLKQPNLFDSVSTKSNFFDIYFKLLVVTENLGNIMTFYDTYVPMHFRPYPETYDSLAEALDLFKADEETIKRIGDDILKFKLGDRVKNDSIFRKNPDYVEKFENQMELRFEKKNSSRPFP